MKKILLFLLTCLAAATAQNFTTVTGSNVQYVTGGKIAIGQICFQATDANDLPISFQAGGGGQVVKAPKCANVIAGVIGSLQVANPTNTNPAGILYRIIVTVSGVEQLRYKLVSFSGGTFNFDNYAPSPGPVIPPSGGTISGNLSVAGNLTVTGSFSAGTILASAFDHTPTLCSAGQAPTGITAAGNATGCAAFGTVTSFSAGTLSPLFTTSVATSTSTPALTFSLSNAGAKSVFGNNTGSSAAPGFQTSISLSGTVNSDTGFTIAGGPETAGHYLRGNGTNYVDNTIQVADVPTLNQSTTGTASNVTGIVAIANGGTGAATAAATSLFGNSSGGVAAPSFSTSAHLSGTFTADGVTTVGSLVSNGNISATSSTVSAAAMTSSGNITTTGSGSVVSGTNVTASSGTVTGDIVNALTGFRVNSGATSGNYLRGNGTNFVSAAISAGDVPTLNQNTTGSANTCTNCRYTMDIVLVAGLDTGTPGTYPALGAAAGSAASPTNTYYRWTPDTALTVTRVQYFTDRAPVNCPRYAEIGFTDGTNKASVTMTNGATTGDSGVISQAYSAGTVLKLAMINGENSGSCDTIAGRTYFVVQYK